MVFGDGKKSYQHELASGEWSPEGRPPLATQQAFQGRGSRDKGGEVGRSGEERGCSVSSWGQFFFMYFSLKSQVLQWKQ